MPRTGNEPSTARSPLRLRLALAGFGLACGLVGLIGLAIAGLEAGAALFGLLGVVAAVDIAVVARHIRQGAHYQPGRDVPPYAPAEPPRPTRRRAAVPPEVRRRRYLILMATCLVLLVVAWVFVRLFSTGLAVGMTLVAMVIPPVAAFVANVGATPPEQ